MLYRWILIRTDNNLYMGFSHADEKPKAGKSLKWVEWGKEIQEYNDETHVLFLDGTNLKEKEKES